MVHLNHIPDPAEEEKHLVQEVKKFHLSLAEHDDQFTTSVYGSRFAAADLPRHEMPEQEMPRDVAYRMIKDELSLDGNPMLNLASFVTTYMEDEAEKLMAESFSKNFIDYEEYPQTAVRFLMHGPAACAPSLTTADPLLLAMNRTSRTVAST